MRRILKKRGSAWWLLSTRVFALLVLFLCMCCGYRYWILGFAPPSPLYYVRSLSYSASGAVPKKIWTYWHEEEMPDFFGKCVRSWRRFNPDYELSVVGPHNVDRYLAGGRSLLSAKPYCDDVRMLSDLVRLHLLAAHGGIWMDAAIVCYRSLDWFRDLAPANRCEYVGYYAPTFTDPAYLSYSPIIESWMFGCVRNSGLVAEWLLEYQALAREESVQAYVDKVRGGGVSSQNIPEDSVAYLAVYLCLQKVLQDPYRRGAYRFHVLPSDETALSYLKNSQFVRETGVHDLVVANPRKYMAEQPVIKICKEERELILQMDYDVLFSYE